MSLAEVVTLYDTNIRDIPEMLRGLADAIELEEAEGINTDTMMAVQLTEGGGLQVYGWGGGDNLKGIALLQLAITSLSTNALGWDD